MLKTESEMAEEHRQIISALTAVSLDQEEEKQEKPQEKPDFEDSIHKATGIILR